MTSPRSACHRRAAPCSRHGSADRWKSRREYATVARWRSCPDRTRRIRGDGLPEHQRTRRAPGATQAGRRGRDRRRRENRMRRHVGRVDQILTPSGSHAKAAHGPASSARAGSTAVRIDMLHAQTADSRRRCAPGRRAPSAGSDLARNESLAASLPLSCFSCCYRSHDGATAYNARRNRQAAAPLRRPTSS